MSVAKVTLICRKTGKSMVPEFNQVRQSLSEYLMDESLT